MRVSKERNPPTVRCKKSANYRLYTYGAGSKYKLFGGFPYQSRSISYRKGFKLRKRVAKNYFLVRKLEIRTRPPAY